MEVHRSKWSVRKKRERRRLSSTQASSHVDQTESYSVFATIKALRKNIRGILSSRDISHRQIALSNNISYEMMTHVEVFSAGTLWSILRTMTTGFGLCNCSAVSSTIMHQNSITQEKEANFPRCF